LEVLQLVIIVILVLVRALEDGKIIIGDGSIIEDNCVIHARPDEQCVIGKRVTVGHASILHNCTIHDSVVIGMGAIISDYAVVGEWAVIGEGAVVPNNKEIPAGAVAVGVRSRGGGCSGKSDRGDK
jgi:carbonic anhydrase/acetyltransferase-like protein (isoleucine patch superfamily)